ncbi:hypothetical protein Tco_0328852 [Tanacetum coccineum]
MNKSLHDETLRDEFARRLWLLKLWMMPQDKLLKKKRGILHLKRGQLKLPVLTNLVLVVADFNNIDDTINVSPIPTLRIHKNHPKDQILGDPKSAVQTRGKIQKASSAQQALFKLQKLWILVDLPSGKKAISTSGVFKNKRDERTLSDRSTTGGCQFLGRRLISWQCKKQTIVANSTTEAEYVAAAHCCHFSPQWKFFIHTILHCLSSKKTAWDQFSSNIATALICLATSRRFNFSKFIFEAMVKNLDSPHKFLLYPRFIQLLLNKQQRLLLPHTRTYPTPTLTSKLFSNMRRASKGYSGVVTPLFENMLVQAHDEEQLQSPSRITSSPSLSQQPTQSSPSPEPIQPTHEAEETASMPHDSPLHAVHSHGSAEGSVQQHDLTVLVTKLNDRIDGLEKDLQQTKKTYSTALTKLVLRVKKLEYKLKSGKARRKAKIVLSDDEEIAEDSSKQGRKISQIDEDPTISLVQDEGISWIPQEEEVHEKPSDETEVLVQEETPTEIIEEHGSGEKGEMEISTANIQVSTASPPKVSTAVPHVYTRRSAKDKGKAIMEEPATPKKVKKRTQVKLSMDEELARKMEEEERIRFNAEQEARALQEEEERLNLEAARELQRQRDQRQENRPLSIAQTRRNMITYLKNQGGYKESYFKKMSYDDIRPIFERVWDHVNTFIPVGSEVEEDSSKPSERETSKIVEEEKVEEENVNPEPVLIEKKAV